jgi:hypothetical protein
MRGSSAVRLVVAGMLFASFGQQRVALAQGNANLAGSWKLDTSQVQPTARAAGPGRAGGPPPSELVIKVAEGQVSVTSDTGTNRAMETAVYKLTGPEQKVSGPLSWTTLAKAAWQGETLVVSIARIIEGPRGDVRIEMKDEYRVSGNVLTLDRSQGPDSWRSVYNRVS